MTGRGSQGRGTLWGHARCPHPSSQLPPPLQPRSRLRLPSQCLSNGITSFPAAGVRELGSPRRILLLLPCVLLVPLPPGRHLLKSQGADGDKGARAIAADDSGPQSVWGVGGRGGDGQISYRRRLPSGTESPRPVCAETVRAHLQDHSRGGKEGLDEIKTQEVKQTKPDPREASEMKIF